MLPGRNLVDVYHGSLLLHKILEQSMDFFDLCFQLLPTFVRRFTEHGYRSFEFTGSRLLKVDIVFFQQAVEIRDLGDNAN